MKHYLAAVLISSIFACSPHIDTPQEYIEKTKSEIIMYIEQPLACGNVKIFNGMILHEYQNSLYKKLEGIDKKDTLIIEECRWRIKNRTLVIWLVKDKSFDCLEWDDSIVF